MFAKLNQNHYKIKKRPKKFIFKHLGSDIKITIEFEFNKDGTIFYISESSNLMKISCSNTEKSLLFDELLITKPTLKCVWMKKDELFSMLQHIINIKID